MEELNDNEIIETGVLTKEQETDVEGDKIVELFCTYILVGNLLYFIANNEMFTVYLLLKTINAHIEFFEENKHFDYDSIERQFIHARDFYKRGQDEEIAKNKACIYCLYQKLETADETDRPLDEKLEILKRILDVLIATLNQFLYEADYLISNDIEEKFTNLDLERVFYDKIYHNMKTEKFITKRKLEEVLN